MSEDTNMFMLIRWIKKQQELELQYQQNMVQQRRREDVEYFFEYMKQLVKHYNKLNSKEKLMLVSFVRQHENCYNFTDKQRSAIGVMYAKYVLS